MTEKAAPTRPVKAERPIEDLKAANAFLATLIDRADFKRYGAPMWHGWAFFDAFLAGMDYARAKQP